MRVRMLLVAVFALVVVTSVTAQTTIPLRGEQPQMTLLSESKAGLTYNIEVGELRALNVSTKGGEFTQLFIPGFHNSMIEGAPQLPQMNRLIAVPADGDVRVEVTNVVTRTLKLADFGLVHPLFPHQPSLSKSQNIDDVPFVYDEAAYRQTKVEAPLASVYYQGRLRAMDIARLEIAPVRYLPLTGELEVVESLQVNVHFDGDWAKSESHLAATDSPFFDVVYGRIDGNRQFLARADLVKDPVKLVIVTPSQFVGQLADYTAWKIEHGFEVITGVIGTPEVGTTTASIQSYLHGLYNAATPGDPAPSFVVFVGDVAECPTWTLGGDATDRPYCAVDGDLFPEMYYGRLSAANSSQLQAILDKTMMYDTYSMPDPSYLHNVTLIAGVDSYWSPTHANGTIRYGEDYYFNAAHNINSYTYYYPASGSSAAAIINNCNTGIGFINYTAHGSTTSWSNPSMTQANVNSMTNAGKYFLAVGNCCLTSTYDIAECFGETFIRAPNKGAVGYIGGSNSTYWHEDVYWSVGNLPQASIREGMTYEETGLGAYDGLFHDMPNEVNDPSTWYVTNDAIIFCGNLAVTESGSVRIEYYWNIYNLLGDPSLTTYLGTPQTNPMTYPNTVFVGMPSINIAAVQGTYVGLTQAGELVGAGHVGPSGQVEITFNRILTPGVPLKLVAMAQNHVPVIEDLLVIVPADVTIDPMVIDANVTTDITVTVMESDGTTPKPGINIWAEGLEYQTTPVATNAAGVAVITVNYPYGPSLDIVGQDPAESYRLFTEPITVNALVLGRPDLTVTTDIGMVDMFPLNLPGTLNASASPGGFTLYALLPDGSLLSSATPSLTVTVGSLGQVKGTIALSGYDLYSEFFDVVAAYGTVAGTVTSGGSPLAGVTVRLVDASQTTVFAVTTGANGAYAGPDEVLVDDYTLVVDHFGYLHYEQPVFVNYGANTFDIALAPAPSGVLSGYVYDSQTMEPLRGNVKIYRSDNGALYNEVNCDENGYYVSGSLPYFTYNVRVRAWHHVPVTAEIIIEDPALQKDWLLDPTNGDILVIDDSTVMLADDKISEKGELLAAAYDPPATKSATLIATDLEELGYYVSVEGISSVDPATFWDYDLVVVACGARTSTLQNASIRTALVQFAQAGGHILLEGGEVGYNHRNSGDFATYVMHTSTWNADSAGSVQGIATDHYVANHPNNLTGTTIQLTYSGYGDSDAMTPLPTGARVMSWTTQTERASVIAYDPNPSPIGGQIVFFCFNYAALAEARIQLLENTVLWLLTPEFGDCAVQGTVLLAGQQDHAGITVRALPGGGSTLTAADGSYALDGLYAGPYTIIASKDGWSVASESVTLAEGETLTGVDMVLTPVATSEYCAYPNLPITDYNTTTSTITVPPQDDAAITALEVFVNISHTYIGDLILKVTSPNQTSVVLHNRSGSSADNIVGWYPGDLQPVGNLDAFQGQQMAGVWTFTVQDMAGGDSGTLNAWCLRLTHSTVVGVDDAQGPNGGAVPSVFMAYHNYPNPFNPMTSIKFDLPRAGQVSLRVYDVAGRLVRTLVDGHLPAASHAVNWDGTDASGRRQASGVYYYRLVTEVDSATHKMTLVK
ncbi:MAG: C25 family cysteine peptidase [Candidatus Krumholzibacteria bacterium]|nr:C25 family cysteine peptidase [Candidatus Krumholzibacteria bacterium]